MKNFCLGLLILASVPGYAKATNEQSCSLKLQNQGYIKDTFTGQVGVAGSIGLSAIAISLPPLGIPLVAGALSAPLINQKVRKNKHFSGVAILAESQECRGEELESAFHAFKNKYPTSKLSLEQYCFEVAKLDRSLEACEDREERQSIDEDRTKKVVTFVGVKALNKRIFQAEKDCLLDLSFKNAAFVNRCTGCVNPDEKMLKGLIKKGYLITKATENKATVIMNNVDDILNTEFDFKGTKVSDSTHFPGINQMGYRTSYKVVQRLLTEVPVCE